MDQPRGDVRRVLTVHGLVWGKGCSKAVVGDCSPNPIHHPFKQLPQNSVITPAQNPASSHQECRCHRAFEAHCAAIAEVLIAAVPPCWCPGWRRIPRTMPEPPQHFVQVVHPQEVVNAEVHRVRKCRRVQQHHSVRGDVDEVRHCECTRRRCSAEWGRLAKPVLTGAVSRLWCRSDTVLLAVPMESATRRPMGGPGERNAGVVLRAERCTAVAGWSCGRRQVRPFHSQPSPILKRGARGAHRLDPDKAVGGPARDRIHVRLQLAVRLAGGTPDPDAMIVWCNAQPDPIMHRVFGRFEPRTTSVDRRQRYPVHRPTKCKERCPLPEVYHPQLQRSSTSFY
eukprot:m.55683 g.55683  ORF g.55683 m.55683 type:complete len:339 (-) comp16909_c0_seq2:24-1040(-)